MYPKGNPQFKTTKTKKMYNARKYKTGTLIVNNGYEGETIEKKIRRIVNNKEPLTDGAPLAYTDRKDGVLPAYNIKTDRWEVAIDAMDVVQKSEQAKREDRMKTKDGDRETGEKAKEGQSKEEGQGEGKA